MHALLLAVGVGSGAAAPLAAAANWVLKDGLGQLGGVAFAAFVNTRFDADPKRWRWLSAAALDAATLVELCTPLAPGAFLPLAALANVGKNVAWLSASATRAGVHQALALHGNLADVTAKGIGAAGQANLSPSADPTTATPRPAKMQLGRSRLRRPPSAWVWGSYLRPWQRGRRRAPSQRCPSLQPCQPRTSSACTVACGLSSCARSGV